MTVTRRITIVPYSYRDVDNYKATEEVMLDGEITDEQRDDVKHVLASIDEEHDAFIPEQIGWEHAGRKEFGSLGDSDHCWHNLDVTEIYVVETSNPAPTQTVKDWVNRMVNAAAEGWDDGQYPEED